MQVLGVLAMAGIAVAITPLLLAAMAALAGMAAILASMTLVVGLLGAAG